METNNESGRTLSIVVGVWLLIKAVVNMFINGIHLSDLGGDILSIGIVAAEFVILYLGIRYTNYVVAGLMALVVIVNLPANINGLIDGRIISSLIYLLEGAVDLVLALVLCFADSVKEHFSKLPSEISK